MSYCFDVLASAYERHIRPHVKDEELAYRFKALLEEMHEANHRLKDAINHDGRVTHYARKLDALITAKEKPDAG